MNTNTLEKMRKMKFYGMSRAFTLDLESGRGENYTPDEMIAHLIEAEWDDRQNRSIDMKIKNARFRYRAALEELNYQNERNLDKNQIMRFAQCNFIKKSENIIITGSAGVGKVTWHRHWGITPAARDTGYYILMFRSFLPNLK